MGQKLGFLKAKPDETKFLYFGCPESGEQTSSNPSKIDPKLQKEKIVKLNSKKLILEYNYVILPIRITIIMTRTSGKVKQNGSTS